MRARSLIPLVCLAVIAAGGAWWRSSRAPEFVPVPVPEETDARALRSTPPTALLPTPPSGPTSSVTAPPSSSAPVTLPPSPIPPPVLPKEINLKATFYAQAPDGDWSMPWQEACEEASVLLAVNAAMEKRWTRAQFRQQILGLVAYQNDAFGDYEHTSVAQTAQMLEHLGAETVIHEDPSFEDLQAILARGHFVVGTFSGKELGNPFYSNGGPTYHAMLIKGYTADRKVIVHDVGTRRGENYVYSWTTIQRTLHDYAVPISAGKKRFIEVIGS